MVQKIAALTQLNFSQNQTLSINIVGINTIKQINWDFVKHEGITDVIAFDYRDETCSIFDNDIAGELFIYPGAAVLESEKRGTSFSYEMILYMVHGILHLSGEDDIDPVKRKRMRRREKFVMNKLMQEFNFEDIFVIEGKRI